MQSFVVRVLLVLICSLALLNCQQETTQISTSVKDVVLLTVKPIDIPLWVELSGRVSAYKKAEVRPQVGGILEKQLFTEGSLVQQGQSLYKIDAALYEADVHSARAELARAEALFTQTQLKRKRRLGLLGSNAVSKQAVEDADADYLQAKADVDLCRAKLATAEIRLRYTDVLAPITGKIGKSNKTQGSLVTAHQSEPLAVIQQLDPVYVDMTRSSVDLIAYRNLLKSGRLVRAKRTVVQLSVEQQSYAMEGELKFSDISVDESTGMVLLRAVFPNATGLLLPGMYVQAKVYEGQLKEAIVLPEKVVAHNARGESSVFVVENDIVRVRRITLDRRLGQQIIVSQGLKEGDTVVVEGLRGLKQGDRVRSVEVLH
ncbi:MAG: efflux RND transporter periplasmic adaptor subunit [Desulfovibrio sp.]|nr:efflux RND transporter periplasmic adaptor subunit [Desulfovibrio sp.]